MKKFYLCLLAIVLFTEQVSAQSLRTEILNGRTVYFIPENTNTHSFDKNQAALQMPNGIGSMKFVLDENGNAWVYSRTGITGDGKSWLTHTDNSHWAITNKNYTGNIYIPSYISTDGSHKIPVVGIEDYAFAHLPLKGTIDIQCKDLRYIGYNAFDVLAADDSYTKVTIKTSVDLVIQGRAFKNSLFLAEQFKPGMTRQYCIDNGYIKDNRTCLKEVNIESPGKKITIQQGAFLYCEGLENATIVSYKKAEDGTETYGEIFIDDVAFACKNVTEGVQGSEPVLVCQPLDRMWDRTALSDSIHIRGKVTGIGNLAFAGHVNIKRVAINSSAPGDYSLTIGQQAFQDLFLFKGYDNSTTDADKEKMGVFIKGPIGKIDPRAFFNFYDSDPTELTPEQRSFLNTAPTGFADCLNKVEIENTSSSKPLVLDEKVFDNRFVQTDHNSYPGSFILKGNIVEIKYKTLYYNDYLFNNGKKSRLRTINLSSNSQISIGFEAFMNQMTSESPDQGGSITLTNVSFIDEKAFYNNEKAMTVTINNNEDGAADLTINNNAFENNFQHTANNGTLTINGKLKSIGQKAFANGYGLKTAEVNKTGSTPLTIDYQAFYQSMGYNKDNLDQPHFTDGSLTLTGALNSIGTQAFSEMRGLKTFNLTSNSRFSIGEEAFMNDITLSKMNYTVIDEEGNPTTTYETLPDSVTKVGNSAFKNTGFQEMTIPQLTLTCKDGGISASDMVKVSVTDGSGTKDYPEDENEHDVYNRNNLLGTQVFANCTKLESVKIENTATGRATFENCSNLSSVEIFQGVKYIESGVFANTPKLKYLEIPESVEAIGAAIHAGSKVTGDYRIEFLATQPPLAHIDAFATQGSSSSNFSQWKAYVVVPWGCVSSYLFCSDNLGFQNVTYDLIACEYKLKNTWGTLGMQAHTNIKEYTGQFTTKADGSYGYMDPKLTSLDKTKVRGDFTDVYDYRRVGISRNDGVATNAKSVGDNADRDALRQEMLNNIEEKVNILKKSQTGLTAHVFGINKLDGERWYSEDLGLARLALIFQVYKDIDYTGFLDEWNYTTIQDLLPSNKKQTFKEKCEALWDELKLSLDRQMHDMELNDFLNNVNLPSIIYGSGNDLYGSSKGIDNFLELFYGAPTLKLLELLQKNEYYEFFVVNFLSGIFQDTDHYYNSIYGNVIPDAKIDWMDDKCNLGDCTADDKTPILNLYNLYSGYTQEVQTAINAYYSAFRDHIDWETDLKFFKSINEPFYVYTADTYYQSTGKVGIDLLTAGPIIPNSLNGQPWNYGYLVKGKPEQTYYLFHYIGVNSGLDKKLNSYKQSDYITLKNSTAVAEFKAGITHCPVKWWDNNSANQEGGTYKYDKYPNLLVAACNASDIESTEHYLNGLSPATDVVNFVLNYDLYQKDATDGVSTKCRFYLLSNGQFARFRNWTQLSEGKSFLALPTQTMAGYPDAPHVGAGSTSSSGDAKAGFFIHNNDFHFSGDFNPIVTDIDTIGYEDEEDGEDIRIVSGYWYTLDGSRLATPPTKKGIYIHNGKKIVVK